MTIIDNYGYSETVEESHSEVVEDDELISDGMEMVEEECEEVEENE